MQSQSAKQLKTVTPGSHNKVQIGQVTEYLAITEWTNDYRAHNARLERMGWAQSVDLPDPWIELRNLWILSSRRNPWIAQGSCLRDLWILRIQHYTMVTLIGADIIYGPIGNLY